MPPMSEIPAKGLYQAITRKIPVALAVVNKSGKVLFHNPAFDVLFGDTQFHVGKNMSEYFEKDALALYLDAMASLISKESDDCDLVLNFRGFEDEQKYLKFQAQNLGFSSPEDTYLCLFEDISEFMDEASRLRKEKELAEQATRSKSAFLANMSHEIRTPIHTVTGMSELILETSLDDEQKEYVQQIRFAAEALLGLINDILDFSKIEAGKLAIENINFDLEAAVETALDMQSLEAFRTGLEVVLNLPANLPPLVNGDPIRLRQILTNLLSNAIKFTKQGHILVTVEILKELANKILVKCTVSDSGIGIPEEKKKLLFHAFSQVDASMSRKFGGTGLGLSICMSLVHLMGGDIGVDSVAGKGSDFWFTLPFAYKASDLPPKPPKAFSFSKILLVDDSLVCREGAFKIFDSLGLELIPAENSDEALELLREQARKNTPIDLAFIDLEMPGIDGWHLASEINADKNINTTRLVLMNPPGKLAGDAKMKLLNWFDAYVAKPLKRREIIKVLASLDDTSLDLEKIPDLPLAAKAAVQEPEILLPGFDILVAEDHFVNQKLFATILKHLGHRALQANNGREAFELAMAKDPDLIFMDVQMPEMNGYDASMLLRSRGFEKPIVAVTANALKGDIEKCLQAGMDDYLAKPFQKSDVEGMLNKWLRKAQAKPDEAAKKMSELPEDVFDKNFALEVFLGDQDLLKNVLSEFLVQTKDLLAALQTSEIETDLKKLSHIAHTLKGSCLNLGLKQTGKAAQALEDLARSDEKTDSFGQDLICSKEAVLKAWDEAAKSIEAWLQNM